MTLPQAAPQRQLRHRRQIEVPVFSRGNGLSAVDVAIANLKTRDVRVADGTRSAGTPIHEMLPRRWRGRAPGLRALAPTGGGLS